MKGHRHDPHPPGKPEPGELPVEPDDGAPPAPGTPQDDDVDTPMTA